MLQSAVEPSFSSAVVEQHRSFDRLGGRREGKTDLAVLRSRWDAVCLFSYELTSDTMWHRVASRDQMRRYVTRNNKISGGKNDVIKAKR